VKTPMKPMNKGREDFGLLNYKNKSIYIIGGYIRGFFKDGETKEVLEYELESQTVKYAPELNVARSWPSVQVIKSKLFAFGGLTDGGGKLNSMEILDLKAQAPAWELL